MCCFVTWEGSRIEDHEVFYCKLRGSLLERLDGIQMFGGKEPCDDGTFRYRVVVKFPRRVHWIRAQEKFMLESPDGEVDTEAISIEVPGRTESVGDFLVRNQANCVKDGDLCTFGERIEFGFDTKPRRDKQAVEALRADFRRWWEESMNKMVPVQFDFEDSEDSDGSEEFYDCVGCRDGMM
jgi:hypothetical protein